MVQDFHTHFKSSAITLARIGTESGPRFPAAPFLGEPSALYYFRRAVLSWLHYIRRAILVAKLKELFSRMPKRTLLPCVFHLFENQNQGKMSSIPECQGVPRCLLLLICLKIRFKVNGALFPNVKKRALSALCF